MLTQSPDQCDSVVLNEKTSSLPKASGEGAFDHRETLRDQLSTSSGLSPVTSQLETPDHG